MPPPSESHLVHPEWLPWEGRRLSADPRPLQTQPEASLRRRGGKNHEAGHPPPRSPDSALMRT